MGIVRRKDRKGHMITAAVKLSEKLERKEPKAPIYSTAFRHALSWNSLKATNHPRRLTTRCSLAPRRHAVRFMTGL